jgi:hypothetical protein
MRNVLILCWTCGLMVIAAACGGERSAAPAAPRASGAHPIELAVSGRSNSAPAVAGWGRMAAVVWTASTGTMSDIYASVSRDSGATFGAPIRVNDVEGDARASGEQPPRVVIGLGDVIHVVWPSRQGGESVIRYAASRDGGASFSSAVTVAGDKVSGPRGWQSVTLGHDGSVHVVWLDGRNAGSRGRGRSHASHHGGQHAKAKGTVDADPRQDVFHVTWKDAGVRSERLVASNVCFCCKTAVATSGDRVYAAWRHIYPGSIRDIAVARSTDNGRTFDAPTRLSDDGWHIAGCPDDGPSMTADAHGGIHVAWPTLVPGDTPRKGIFYSFRAEGSDFTPRLRLDSGESAPAHPQIGSDDHGNSAIVWDELAGAERRIVLRRVTNGVPEPPEVFDGKGANYPAVAPAEGHWVLVWSAQDATGRPVIEGRRLAFTTH